MKPKDRMVSFRISAEEYDRLRKAGSVHGLTNISELARVAMNRMLEAQQFQREGFLNGTQQETSAHLGLPEQVQELRVQLEGLSSEVKRLSRALPAASAGISE